MLTIKNLLTKFHEPARDLRFTEVNQDLKQTL